MQRRYDAEQIDRLYRIRLLRELGRALGEIDTDSADLVTLTRRHLHDQDRRIGELARHRGRVRSVEERRSRVGLTSPEVLVGSLPAIAPVKLPVTLSRGACRSPC